MGSVTDQPQLAYPAPLSQKEDVLIDVNGDVDLETPVLIVGGGPVGMLQALMFARLHAQPCMLIERELTTTIYPKMEYTNGRSMDVYRMMGLHEEVRALAETHIPSTANLDELIVTGLTKESKVVHVWERDSPAAQRNKGYSQNDGSQYLEPHMRCHQILIEAWLKKKIESEPLIQSSWGTSFVNLLETPSHVLARVRKSDGTALTIKSQYLIGCDGGGSLVRKSVNLEARRKHLNLSMAFLHFRSTPLRTHLNSLHPPFWHANVIGGTVLVSQNSTDLFTTHVMLLPGVEPSSLTPSEILSRCVNGCAAAAGGTFTPEIDQVLCRGGWKVDVAIAESFRSGTATVASGTTSTSGRVLLAGDAAHQLSPIGGHGLNSGVGDAHGLAWVVSARLKGWGGEGLLEGYDFERRQIAFENLGHVQRGLETVLLPVFSAHVGYGVEGVCGEGEESERIRKEIKRVAEGGYWLHNQNGNILGYSYKGSGIILEGEERGERPEGTAEVVVPNTWPGSQMPRVWMGDGKRNTFDELRGDSFNLVDFSDDGRLSAPFVEGAEELGVPLKVLRWYGEHHVREIYERDLVLIRPDTHVAWRIADGITEVPSREEALRVLKIVSGHSA